MVPTLFAACYSRGRPSTGSLHQHREERGSSLAEVVAEIVRETQVHREANAKRQESDSNGFKCGYSLELSRPRCHPR